jgi:hypothetical protein
VSNFFGVLVAKKIRVNHLKKSKSLFGRLLNEVRRNSADKVMAFHRSSLREKALPKNAKPTKSLCVTCAISVKKTVKSVKSVVNFSSRLSAFVAMSQLCKTNPISEKPK